MAYNSFPKEKIEKMVLLHSQGMTCRAIAKELNTDHGTVSNNLKKQGISVSHSQGRQRASLGENQFIEITEPLREILEGNLLGDGSLIFTPSKLSAGYGHGALSLAHIEWLKNELDINGLPTGPINVRPPKDVIIKSGVNEGNIIHGNGLYQFRSVHIPILGEMKKRWYKPKKRVPSDLVLTPNMLLHWYLGDGSKATDKYRTRLTLYTNYFPLKDQKILVSNLEELGVHASISKSATISGHGMRLSIAGESNVDIFFDLLGPCPPELIADYGHKWPN